jgi:cell division transport system permease protein
MPTTDARLLRNAHQVMQAVKRDYDEIDIPAEATKSPVVPPSSISGRALIAVIAIMSFLAAVTLGAVVLMRGAAAEWQSQVSREVTIQIRPTNAREIDAAVARAAEIARSVAGIASVKVFSREESARLLEPWLGSGLSLEALPVPRMLVVTLAAGEQPDLEKLRRTLKEQVPGSSLDDHRGWVERMRSMTRMVVIIGLGVLALVLSATILLVAFATRGAMATNRAIVEVLHFVGAKNRYIAGQFQRHFLILGLKGAGIGGAAALVVFGLATLVSGRVGGVAGEEQVEALFGGLSLGPDGYAGIFGLVVLVAAVTAVTSRLTVHRTLAALE